MVERLIVHLIRRSSCQVPENLQSGGASQGLVGTLNSMPTDDNPLVVAQNLLGEVGISQPQQDKNSYPANPEARV